MERLTTWNGKKYVLPQGYTSDGKSYWRMATEKLAAYENMCSDPDSFDPEEVFFEITGPECYQVHDYDGATQSAVYSGDMSKLKAADLSWRIAEQDGIPYSRELSLAEIAEQLDGLHTPITIFIWDPQHADPYSTILKCDRGKWYCVGMIKMPVNGSPVC